MLIAYYFRKGELSRSDIEGRRSDSFTRAILQRRDNYEPEGVEKIDADHPNVDLFTSDIDNDFLIAKLCEGREGTEFLERTIGDIKGRSDPDSNPEWRNLWYFLHQDDAVITSSFERMMKKFEERQYTDAGEILHVFGLLYEMKSLGLLNISKKEIEKNGKRYIDDLLMAQDLPLMREDYIGGFRHGAAHGLGFTNSGEPGFRRLLAYFNQRSHEGKDRQIKSEIDDILELEPFDVEKFRALILQGERDDNVYARPFMDKIDPAKFAGAVLASKAEMQFEVLYALRGRYHQSPFPEVRATEAPWLRRLIHALRRAPKSDISRERLNRTIDMTILDPSKIR